MGSPKGREPYGDGVPVVVAGVTTCQGGRESRPQGEGAQVIGRPATGRYAKCRAPKRYWVSSVNAAGRGLPCERAVPTAVQPAAVPAGLRAHLRQRRGDDAGGHRGDRGRHVPGEDRRDHRRDAPRALPVHAGPAGLHPEEEREDGARWACRPGRTSWSAKWSACCLEAYYEPQFSDRSHGFRPGRGCHTALREVANDLDGDDTGSSRETSPTASGPSIMRS